MTDFDKFENELSELYSNYVLKFRILSYLEKELEGHFRTQREKVQVQYFVNTLSSSILFFRKFLVNTCNQSILN